MLRLSSTLYKQPLLSLRTSEVVGLAQEPIINPHNLKILGWWCKSGSSMRELILLTEDVRDIAPAGLVINSEEDLAEPEDLARHKEILDIRFELLDKTVRTKRHKLGKVSDFSYNDGMFVQKLYVARPLVKIFSSEDTLIIDRRQILEVTDSHILIKDSEIPAGEKELAGAPATS